ncbi:hypothetical protein AO721_07585 [Aeromonas veronii]|uniref:hypothetical protein n=1 Tax=Aeromonas veronii TaxID=654 RepID=UPI0007188FDE|nr:hypothetical protein [Aeromonas veronii]KRV68067.1 hypothetical protein AO728_15845 [Aeromonas veronii]KRV77531.1 hypothetical protein AO719_16610 [Aeromonas veronii]KRV84531.1 hypothetical protein AO721_07585 [Aeromonas veronii]KRV84813.1 hypothetical protein AO739_06780 [Aeromonas veronii]
MKFIDAKKELIQILQDADTRFISAYQICIAVETKFPKLWDVIQSEYGTATGNPTMGSGAGQHYSPASFVSQALEYFSKTLKEIKKEYFTCEGVIFSNIEPGYTGNVVAIWAWQE